MRDAIVLPGVGAFGDCVRGLQTRGLWEPLRAWLAADKPFLGICVGYQMLFEESEESPGVRGFGFFRRQGEAVHHTRAQDPADRLESTRPRRPPSALARPARTSRTSISSTRYFPAPLDDSIITSRSTYGETFAASAARGHVSAVQFHPEKSQAVGLGILRNFIGSVDEEGRNAK